MTSSVTDSSLKKKAILLFVIVLGLLGLTLTWRWTALGEWLDVPRLVGALRQFGGSSGPLAAIACVSLASVAAIPLAIIILASVMAFGSWPGLAYVLSGACLGAVISFGIGNYLGHDALCRLAGARVNRLSSRLARRGLLAIIVLRMTPIAPFAVVNMIAGTTHIRLRDFLLGTLIGMIPGALVMTVFADQIVKAIFEPGKGILLLIGLTLVLVVAGSFWFRKWLARVGR